MLLRKKGDHPREQQECKHERSLMIPMRTLVVGTGRVQARSREGVGGVKMINVQTVAAGSRLRITRISGC